MLRVLHVIARFDAGGTELQLAGTVEAARRRLWDPTLCVLNEGGSLVPRMRDAGIPVIELQQTRRRDVRRILRLRELMREGAFDVVQSSLWRANVITRLAAAYPSRPAVVLSERAQEEFRPRRERLVDMALRPLADQYIGNSASLAAFISRAHGVPAGRVTVVPNAVDGSIFRPAERVRRLLPLIGSVGRLVPQKGFDVLLEALPRVLVHRPVEVVVHGEGPGRQALERAARGLPVQFPGFLATPCEVARFMRGLDLFVLPSRYEGRPNVVQEALACGVPVVATDVPGMREASRGAATLIPAEDAQALAEAILAALERERRPPALTFPSFEDVALAHLVAFERALERRKRSG